MAAQPRSRALLFLTVLAAPGALGFETLLRALLFPPDFELLRAFLSPVLTHLAWVLGLVAAAGSLIGLALQRSIAHKRLARLPEGASEEVRYQQVLAVFLLTTAAPQIPAILATFALMFGASLTPVLIGVGICSLGVIAQALRVSSLAAAARRRGRAP